MVFVWLIVVWEINEMMNSPAATSSKIQKWLPGGNTSLLQHPLPRRHTTRIPLGTTSHGSPNGWILVDCCIFSSLRVGGGNIGGKIPIIAAWGWSLPRGVVILWPSNRPHPPTDCLLLCLPRSDCG